MPEHQKVYHSYEPKAEPISVKEMSFDGRVQVPVIGEILTGIVFQSTNGKLTYRTPFKTGLKYILVLDRNNVPVEDIQGKPIRVEILEDLHQRSKRKGKELPKFLCKIV